MAFFQSLVSPPNELCTSQTASNLGARVSESPEFKVKHKHLAVGAARLIAKDRGIAGPSKVEDGRGLKAGIPARGSFELGQVKLQPAFCIVERNMCRQSNRKHAFSMCMGTTPGTSICTCILNHLLSCPAIRYARYVDTCGMRGCLHAEALLAFKPAKELYT